MKRTKAFVSIFLAAMLVSLAAVSSLQAAAAPGTARAENTASKELQEEIETEEEEPAETDESEAEETKAEETEAEETKAEETKAEETEAEEAEEAGTEAEAAGSDEEEREDSPEWITKLDAAEDASQLFVVAGIGGTTAYISMHEKDEDGNWKQIMTTPGFIGKYGLGKAKEGDARTPVGTFGFNYAFGIAEDPGCALEYHQVDDNDYWSGDQREGYHYNEMVDISDYPDLNTEDSEHIVDYKREYQYCLNVSYNEEGTPGEGSAIFLHCLGAVKPYTGGCIAIPKDQMLKVMQNVREDCVVVIDSLQVLSPETWEKMGLPTAEDHFEKAEAETRKISAIYAAAGAQIVTKAGGVKELADTFIYMYEDGAYRQYVMLDDAAVAFSEGVYELNGEKDSETPEIMTLTVQKLYREGRGLVNAGMTYDINLAGKKDYCLYNLDEEDKEIKAAFLQADKQKLVLKDETEEYLSTLWIYYDDGTFKQYAILDNDEVLFSTGDYSIDGKFTDKESVLTIHRDHKYADGSGLKKYDSTHDYVLGDLDFIRILPEQKIGQKVTIPEEYADKLIVKTREAGRENEIISVYESKSVEAAAAEGWSDEDGAGWIFSIGTVSAEELQEMLCNDMSGADVFAKDVEGRYYVYYHPTDVRLVREGNDYSAESVREWSELHEWAATVKESFVKENDGLIAMTFDNSTPAMYLSRAAYEKDAEYTLSTTEHGPLEPDGVDAAPYVEKLIRNAVYEYIDGEEAPDGEYVVYYYPEDDVRLDFFLAEGSGNYVRQTNSKGENEQLYLVKFADEETVASAVMQDWYKELAEE